MMTECIMQICCQMIATTCRHKQLICCHCVSTLLVVCGKTDRSGHTHRTTVKICTYSVSNHIICLCRQEFLNIIHTKKKKISTRPSVIPHTCVKEIQSLVTISLYLKEVIFYTWISTVGFFVSDEGLTGRQFKMLSVETIGRGILSVTKLVYQALVMDSSCTLVLVF